jgi:LPXTG-motif cell wall-anchored protein
VPIIQALDLLLPGASVRFVVLCNTLIAGRLTSGTGASTPFALPSTPASNGSVTFRATLPSDFQLNATHGITIRDDATGITLGSGRFFVNSRGQIAGNGNGTGTGSGLPKTGTNHIGDLVKAGGALVALGGVVLLATKRRKAALVR